ncbi:FAD-dependent oxidoreductase [Pseudomonas aeruginosa]|uniref:FAD-dependent oxidoreductase n=1 Tax=Pseudomonas aeruginosa TaxID=287 RepID=UPI00066BD985|nr:FAD-dependent oxidoreductase [Pseudomonas aeruginosa]
MSFDFDLFVIGAGSGGVRAARFAAGFGARVAVAESRYLGGTCVNVGCVPKKLLVYGAHFSEDFEQARAYGWSAGEAQFDWATLIGNKNREIQRLNGIYRNLLVNSGVTLLEGHARLLNSDIARIDKQADGSLAATLKDGRVLEADCVFYATGRRPMLDDLGLENTAVKLTDKGFIAVDEHYQTSEPSILALGDVIGRVQLTPVALAEGMAVARRLFKPEEYRPVDYKLIPTAVFSLPNIGTVGLTEEEALSAGHKVKIFESRFRPMKLTLTDDQEKTLMKLVVDAHDDRVLGCHMVGAEAGEILQGIAVAMKAGATKQAFDETIGIHPTAAEEFVTLRTPTR